MNIAQHVHLPYPISPKALTALLWARGMDCLRDFGVGTGWGRAIMALESASGQQMGSDNPGNLLRAGDWHALDALYLEHNGRLHALAGAFGFSGVDAEDLVQETFLRVWRFRAQAPLEADKLSGWLTSILANGCKAVHQKNARWLKFRSMLSFMKSAQSTSAVPAPDSMLQAKELWEQVLSAVEGLDPLDRMVIVLAKLEGLKSPQIAKVLSMEPGTVRVRLFRAMQQIRTTLEDKSEW